jgi:hypothetical protein
MKVLCLTASKLAAATHSVKEAGAGGADAGAAGGLAGVTLVAGKEAVGACALAGAGAA